MKTVGVGIIGGGLMGREVASTFARWCALEEMPVRPELRAVADTQPSALDWFRKLPGEIFLTQDYGDLLQRPDVEVVYVAVPHHLHEKIYSEVLAAGRDLLAEKPFGIDLAAARRVAETAERSGRFVRCSSEFPFVPGAQRVFAEARGGRLGRILEARCAFLHSSDLDPDKPANWKRRGQTCGQIGVMGDLGMHVCHLPLRLGWFPKELYAQLQKGYQDRPDGKGGRAACDTWDNATLSTWIDDGQAPPFPLTLEMKRLAPGETNTWCFEVLGTEGGARFNTREPKTLWLFEPGKEQFWKQTSLGFSTPFKTVTGGIFEPGFPDFIQQMWAAFLVEREGLLDEHFGCATPREAVQSHEIFAAALESASAHGTVSLAGSESR